MVHSITTTFYIFLIASTLGLTAADGAALFVRSESASEPSAAARRGEMTSDSSSSLRSTSAVSASVSSERVEVDKKERGAAQAKQKSYDENEVQYGIRIGKRRKSFDSFLAKFTPGELCPRARQLAQESCEDIIKNTLRGSFYKGVALNRSLDEARVANADLLEKMVKLRNNIRLTVVAQVNMQAFTQQTQDHTIAQLLAAQESGLPALRASALPVPAARPMPSMQPASSLSSSSRANPIDEGQYSGDGW